ncbi:protein C-ets-2-like [Dendronephthya gigantea]|uniref:protein C-ets-2-like n=1 Tax=Dendronephthya gigantea TaxID=151771 RepID=UPI00106DC3DB|nr:protein C-ets-2-like [Dendronephthya gigantea]
MPFRRTSYFIWEFILAMLQEEECSSIISWTKESDLEFEIKDMAELAQLWGMLRGRPEMDKKSFFRAFRYYYKINVIIKVKSGRRLYRFNNHPFHIAKKAGNERKCGKKAKIMKIVSTN